MRIAKQGAVILFAGAFALACAEDTEGGGNNNSNSGGSTSNSGGSTNSSGGSTNNTGGTTNNNSGGTTNNNTGGTTNNTGGTTGEGTPVTGAAWAAYQGTINDCTPLDDVCAFASSVSFTGSGQWPTVSLHVAGWGDACFDASAYTGIRFNVEGTGLTSFGVLVEGAIESGAECGSCDETAMGDDADPNCRAQFQTTVSGSGPISIPFSELAIPQWKIDEGTNLTLTLDKIKELAWNMSENSTGTITISNIEFY